MAGGRVAAIIAKYLFRVTLGGFTTSAIKKTTEKLYFSNNCCTFATENER